MCIRDLYHLMALGQEGEAEIWGVVQGCGEISGQRSSVCTGSVAGGCLALAGNCQHLGGWSTEAGREWSCRSLQEHRRPWSLPKHPREVMERFYEGPWAELRF